MLTELAAFGLIRQEDPEQAKQLAREQHALIADCVSCSPGVVVKSTESTALVEFPGVVSAARCALDIQIRIAARNATTPTGGRLALRIGLHFATVTPQEGDPKGDWVDLLAALGQHAPEVGGICVSQVVRDGLRDQPGFSFDDLGEQAVSGRPKPEHLYLISIAGGPARARSLEQPKIEPPPEPPRKRRGLFLGIGVGGVVAAVALFAWLRPATPPVIAPVASPPTAPTPEVVAPPVPATPPSAPTPEPPTTNPPAQPKPEGGPASSTSPEAPTTGAATPSATPTPPAASAEPPTAVPPTAVPAKTMLQRVDDVLARVEKLPKAKQKKLLPDLKQWKAVERAMKRGRPNATVNPRVLARLEQSLDEIERISH